jgi:hypothetical protein
MKVATEFAGKLVANLDMHAHDEEHYEQLHPISRNFSIAPEM